MPEQEMHRDCAHVLKGVLARAREFGPRGVVIFDLDSTLFDNRPRQARILREFGQALNIPILTRCVPSHFVGWDLRVAMRNCGMTPAEAERLYPEAKRFWQERFFTSDYCADDVAIQGAAEFVRAIAQTGAMVCYVTGRHEGMRAGTLEAMRRCQLLPPSDNVHMVMKPTLEMGDDDFKREAHRQAASLGTVIAAFDNEPTHVNDYRRTFPDATIVHLATDHSGRPVALLDGVLSIPHFAFVLGRTACSIAE